MESMPTDRLVIDTALAVCEAGQTPRCLTVAILIRYCEWEQLARLRTDPLTYLDREHYYVDSVATEFLRKFEPLPTGVDKAEAARKGALEAEFQCYKTNERLAPYIHQDPSCELGVSAYITRVRKKVKKLLGPVPDYLDGKFGKGATFADKGQLITVPDKMTSAPAITRDCDIVLYHWWETAWGRACQSRKIKPLITRGNRFTTVPKDAVKHRPIAIEPSLNVFYQLAVGSHLKRRLRGFGIDLFEGQEVHRQVACQASRDGALCTIDLSNASDTVSYNLVKLLLPPLWFQLLDSLRSPYTFGLAAEKSWLKLEKFSSMGNGFTFELETLIFYSLVKSVCEDQLPPDTEAPVYVYGDDIICPSAVYREVKAVLEFFGMTLNGKKSFHEGYFRESCGGDFWAGANVRPFNLEDSPDEPQKIISLANGIRRIYTRSWIRPVLRKRYLRAWFIALDALPSSVRRCRGPESLGDLVVHDDETNWQTRTKHSIRYVKVWRPARLKAISWNNWGPDVVLAAALYGVRDTLSGPLGSRKSRGVTPRDAVTGYRLGWVACS